MLFLIENAPLENWERDIMSMLREEAYYSYAASSDQNYE